MNASQIDPLVLRGIDPRIEKLIRLADVPKLPWMPPSRSGKRRSIAFVFRCASERGYKGVVLETMRIGGTRYTTEAALLRFFARLSATDQTQRMGAVVAQDDEAVEAELTRQGFKSAPGRVD